MDFVHLLRIDNSMSNKNDAKRCGHLSDLQKRKLIQLMEHDDILLQGKFNFVFKFNLCLDNHNLSQVFIFDSLDCNEFFHFFSFTNTIESLIAEVQVMFSRSPHLKRFLRFSQNFSLLTCTLSAISDSIIVNKNVRFISRIF
jgi:hypothetical protein